MDSANHVRVGGGEILGFADVHIQIAEFAASQVELLWASMNGFDRQVAMEAGNLVWRLGGCLS